MMKHESCNEAANSRNEYRELLLVVILSSLMLLSLL